MGKESIEEHPTYKNEDIENMSFEDLESNPEYSPILQEQALNYLKTEDEEYFNREFTGELDDEGYLIRKSGKAITKPSMAFGPAGMDKVLSATKKEILERRE